MDADSLMCSALFSSVVAGQCHAAARRGLTLSFCRCQIGIRLNVLSLVMTVKNQNEKVWQPQPLLAIVNGPVDNCMCRLRLPPPNHPLRPALSTQSIELHKPARSLPFIPTHFVIIIIIIISLFIIITSIIIFIIFIIIIIIVLCLFYIASCCFYC